MPNSAPDASQEFDRQIERLLQLGYPDAMHISKGEFMSSLNDLRARLGDVRMYEPDMDRGKLPMVIVIPSSQIPAETAMSLALRDGKHGITKLYPHMPGDFRPIDGVDIPGTAYIIVDVDRGKDTINVPPSTALTQITGADRSPLTIDEGVAILTQYPNFLMKNNCFSLLASRHAGDKRVPAIWINSNKHPNLGWCWEGNPHTWLGSASCAERI